VGGGRDDAIGRVRVGPDERPVVPPDLGARPLGPIEEVEVVHGDHARRPSGRNAEGVGSMGEVELPAEQEIGGRPAEAVPAEVQHLDGHTQVVDMQARRLPPEPRVHPIFQELLKRWMCSSATAGEVLSASSSSCWYSPTPVRCRSAGR
jgi:hypothetical protein